MAGFQGIRWAEQQGKYPLKEKVLSIVSADDRVTAISRSIHYGLFLAFEGIRFFVEKHGNGYRLVFMNLGKNLSRFRKSIAFNLSRAQQALVPTDEELVEAILSFFRDPSMTDFLVSMGEDGAQGYLRPFTFDETRSIGVTFPDDPTIRMVAARYDGYLGEPFTGVTVPTLVRAVGANGMGCLKLGVNYLVSVKAVDAAQGIIPGASAALMLDDRPDLPVQDRKITEWDSSCALFAFRDGTVVKIPESPLILPSVTIQGIVALLKSKRVPVEERDISYGELIDAVKAKELIAVCSVGTAGILNRAERLVLTDMDSRILADHRAETEHEVYEALGVAKAAYWDLYRGKVHVPEGLSRDVYDI